MKRYAGNTIIVSVSPDRFGNWLVKVVSQDHNDKIAAYLKQFGEKWDGAYLQTEDERSGFVELSCMSRAKQKDLDKGWPVKIAVGKWEFLQGVVGYSAGDANILG